MKYNLVFVMKWMLCVCVRASGLCYISDAGLLYFFLKKKKKIVICLCPKFRTMQMCIIRQGTMFFFPLMHHVNTRISIRLHILSSITNMAARDYTSQSTHSWSSSYSPGLNYHTTVNTHSNHSPSEKHCSV